MSFTSTTWVTGRTGPASLGFDGGSANDGSRAWVSNAAYRLLPVSGRPWSLSLCFNAEALTPGWRTLVGSNSAQEGTNGWEVALGTQGAGTNYLVFRGTPAPISLNITGRTLLLPGEWHELTVTHDGNKGAIYLDARMLAEGVGQLALHDGPIYIGGGLGNYQSFLGRIDDVRIYTNCLTREMISQTGHWRFDENEGVFTGDRSIKGHHGRVTDAGGWVPGREGSGVQLNVTQVAMANDDYTLLPGSGGSFSISFWLRPNLLLPGKSGLMSCGTGNNNGWQLAIDSDGSASKVHFASTNGGGTLDLSVPVALTNGVWTKVDVTYNGGIATIYANGRKLQAGSGAIRGSRAPLLLGAAQEMPGLDAVLDDLIVYSHERDAAEIGPVARTMWETVFVNSATNITLEGYGPADKPLTYSIVPVVGQTNGSVAHSGGSAVVTYIAGPKKGPDAFAYTVSDGEFTSEPAIVAISVVQPHWLSAAGGLLEPLDGSSPEHAWNADSATAVDAIWTTNNYYDCFFYAPGEYETRGMKYLERSTANPGCKHIGAGSNGGNRTTVKLVDSLEASTEGITFAASHPGTSCDGFELQHMLLDCNAENNPKYARGEPIWIRIPLTSTTRVETVTLKWKNNNLPFTGLRLGRASEFSLAARLLSGVTSNWMALTSTGQVDVVTVGTEADELILQLERRAQGVDFYSLGEIEVAGGTVSVPRASIPGSGPSRLNSQYSIALAFDDNPGTSWASGAEEAVEILLPLERDTPVNQIVFQWNCRTITNVGRFGLPAQYAIRARDAQTGEYYDTPFVRRVRTANGLEIATFGTDASTNTLTTDSIMIVLTAKESGVDYYSIRELSLQNGSQPLAMRLPSARTVLNWGANYTTLRAFDGTTDTEWVCGSQGSVTAIGLAGNNLKFIDLRIVGFGTKGLRECFPMFIPGLGSPTTPAHLGNVLIENCSFGEPATKNRDGLTTVVCAAAPPDTLTNAVIRGCTISGLKPYFSYSHGFSANHVENCFVSDCTQAVYFEPDARVDDLGPVLVRSNQFVNVDNGVYLTSHPGTLFDSITCLNNEVVLNGGSGWGFAACDACAPGPSASITNVTMLNNIIRYRDWLPRPSGAGGGVYYTDIRHGVFGNNVIALGTPNDLRIRHCPAGVIFPPDPTEDCEGHVFVPPGQTTYPACLDVPPAGYRRAWFNNRTLSGTLLDVRFLNRGVDGLSSQQQWPE